MLFNSYIFILFFLPLTLFLYYLLHFYGKEQWAYMELAGMSLWFYGYFHPSYLLIICSSILVNYTLSRLFQHNTKPLPNLDTSLPFLVRNFSLWKKWLLGLGLFFNLGLLFYFKYYDFFLDNINLLFHQNFTLRHIVLPLGISFFTFQQVSYLIDSYRGETGDYSLLEYTVFVTFFPQLVAGPIVLHHELLPQLQNKENHRLDQEWLAKGVMIFAVGLFKKVILADTLGKAVTWGFGRVEALSSVEAFIVMLSYTLQIYLDFSGYCDMALGIGKMFHIELPMNFQSPYKSFSIVEFWKRWHITLTRFLRQYIYFPLGGSRKGELCTYRNILLVFLASGLWHGANWTFILWGLLHGLANALTRKYSAYWEKMHLVMQWGITFLFLNFTWVVFRADSIAQAKSFLRRLVEMQSFSVSEELLECFHLPEFTFFMQQLHISEWSSSIRGIEMSLMLLFCFVLVMNGKNCYERNWKISGKSAAMTMILLVWSIMSLAGVSVFLYFNF